MTWTWPSTSWPDRMPRPPPPGGSGCRRPAGSHCPTTGSASGWTTRRVRWTPPTWTGLAGASYLPAAVAPAGHTSAGLPVGIQIVAPFLEDRTTVDMARHLERVLGGFQAPPGF